ncbi:chloride nucleotide-sensitive channel icln [Anticarsia gemmatalis]|uniref:chloride nucleotide-sensitive channel icln n=1 Tax=Anticarsia gemmatalis TaxID=129554 RepID=UPI003F763EDA
MVVVSSTFSVPAEGVLSQTPQTKLIIDDTEVGTGTLYVTESNVVWGGVDAPTIVLRYPSIAMHAIQRTPSPALYLAINYELRLPGQDNQQSGGGDANDDDDDEDNAFDGEEASTQLRFVPENENDLQGMYNAMTQGQTLNPDPNVDSCGEDEDHYMDGEEFDDGEDEFEDAEESNMGGEDPVVMLRQMRLKNGHPPNETENDDADVGE